MLTNKHSNLQKMKKLFLQSGRNGLTRSRAVFYIQQLHDGHFFCECIYIIWREDSVEFEASRAFLPKLKHSSV